MISDRLIDLVQCPECQSQLTQSEHQFACDQCDRAYPIVDSRFVDLRPEVAFEEQTKYLDESLHADGRHERVSPPLLTAGVRHRMLRRLLPFTGSLILVAEVVGHFIGIEIPRRRSLALM